MPLGVDMMQAAVRVNDAVLLGRTLQGLPYPGPPLFIHRHPPARPLERSCLQLRRRASATIFEWGA